MLNNKVLGISAGSPNRRKGVQSEVIDSLWNFGLWEGHRLCIQYLYEINILLSETLQAAWSYPVSGHLLK